MFKLIVAVVWISFCLIQSGQTTNNFLRSLLTTTPAATHISDFRMQKRTDSRADKPDTFPGFDLHEDATSPSPRKRRRQAYSQLIRLILQNTRDRLGNIRDVVKDESEQLNFHIVKSKDEKVPSIESRRSDELVFLDLNDSSENREFDIDLAFDDGNISEELSTGDASNTFTPQRYFNSLLSAIGLSRAPMSTIPVTQAEKQTAQDNIVTAYLVNPLLGAWHSAQQQFNFNQNYRIEKNSDNDNVGDGDASARDTAVDEFNFNSFDNSKRDDSENEMHKHDMGLSIDAGATIAGVAYQNDMRVRANNFNHDSSSSLVLLSPSTDDTKRYDSGSRININVTKHRKAKNSTNNISSSAIDDEENDDEESIGNKKPRHTAASSTIEKAALAFQNAFYKYSNYMRSTNNSASSNSGVVSSSSKVASNSSENGENAKTIQQPNIDVNDKLLEKKNSSQNLSEHVQVVPARKTNANGNIIMVDERGTNAMVFNGKDDEMSRSDSTTVESAGILVLEIFGTVIGMTWGAISQVQNYLNGNNNNNNETIS